MPKVIITHDVQDAENWLKGKADRAEAIKGMGGTNVVDHVAQDGSNKIAVSAQTDDVNAILAALASPPPDVLETMKRHGVIPPFTVYVEK